MRKTGIFFLLALLLWMACVPQAEAKAKKEEVNAKRVLFIPHDNRPISDKQTADALRERGYEVIVPPDDMLGGRTDLGNPDALWQWANENAAGAKAAVISSDAMLYGSLVASRKHDYPKQEILARADRFKSLKSAHPGMELYVFGSIMRTPRSGEASGSEEPSYYKSYGAAIFRYTALTDKKETEGLTRREQKEHDFLAQLIPQQAIQDWLSRRQENLSASERLIDLTRNGTLDYFVLGRDDNAPFSQTHLESRQLQAYSKGLGPSKYQSMAGIDEIAMLLMARAANGMEREVPFVNVKYNYGTGARTIPAYSDEPIDDSIRAAVTAAGGMVINSPEKAEFLLLVNTNPNGKTYEANDRANTEKPREGTDYFANLVADNVAKGYPVGIADVAFANGADNALMQALKNKGLLFRVRAYAGWNTPTNSTGFAIGEGILAGGMTDIARDNLLLTRYLDDWAYQANVRTVIGRQLNWLRGSGAYANLDDKRIGVEYRAGRMLQEFADSNLPPFSALRQINVTFPWNRMFEADIETAKN